MALHNEILVGRFNRFAQRHFGLKGGPAVPQLSSELQLQMSIKSGIENYLLESWNRYVATGTVPATVGIGASARLRNPRGSNTLIVVERITVSGISVAGEVDLFRGLGTVQANDLGGTGSFSVDPRQTANPAAQTSVGLFSMISSAAVVGGAISGRFFPTVGGTNELIAFEDHEIPLVARPGSTVATVGDDFLDVRTVALNTTMTVWMQWRERPLEEGELLST